MTNLLRKPYLIPLLIALAGLLIYATTFTVPFQFDDDAYVVNNPAIRDFSTFLSPHDITGGSSLTPTGIPPALRFAFMTRILGYVSLAVNYQLHGLNVTGYHVVNLLLHILNACLLYGILRHTFRGVTRTPTESDGGSSVLLPLVAALLFLCHPIQTHAVTYISSRFVLLASFFSLLALLSYIRFRTAHAGNGRTAFQILAVLSAAAGMLCKEFTFTLPFLILLYEVSFFSGSPAERLRSLAPLGLTLPIIPLLVFFQQGSVTALDSTMRTITAADSSQIARLDYLLTQFRVIVMYLRLLIFPAGQNIDHDIPVQHSLASLPVLASFLLLLTLLAWACCRLFRSMRNNETTATRIIPFGIIWFFTALSVESSIIPLGELQAEYRLYLPSIGFFVAVTALGAALSRRSSQNRNQNSPLSMRERVRVRGQNRENTPHPAFGHPSPLGPVGPHGEGLIGRSELRIQTAFSVISGILIITLCTATVLRNRVWQSEISLWRDAAAKSPAKIRPHQNLALYYGMQGQFEQARRELQLALAIEPRNFELHNNLGIVYKQLGDLDRAIQEYQTVLSLVPQDAMARYNLGNIYLAQGKLPDAIREYRECMKIVPDYDEVHNNLAIALEKSGRIDEAIVEFRRALDLNPQNINAGNNLLTILRKSGVTIPP